MRHLTILVFVAMLPGLPGTAQAPDPLERDRERTDIRLPSGKSQREEILKADYKKAVEEAGALVRLAEDLRTELERDDRHVLSVTSLKKTEEIEKLAKRIRGRLKRY